MVGAQSFPYGAFVIDTEDPSPDLAVVVNHPPEAAAEWELTDGETVADRNPTYPPDAPVLVVSFHEQLSEYDPDWKSYGEQNRSLAELAAAGVGYYAFPRPRLERAPRELIGEAVEPTPHAQALYERLAGQMDAYFLDERTIEARKFGEIYRLRPGEVVSSGGVLHSRLCTLVEEYDPSEPLEE